MAKAVEGPDSGYSWVIMLCCAYIHFALYGLFRSSGVMFVAILQNYDVTREAASWPFALVVAVFQLVGPIGGVLTYYMSQRKACILGSLIASFGMGACYFAESVMWINIFYGLVHGVGFGILNVLFPVILNQYFVKHKATAMGIAFSGGALSSFIYPMAMEWLLSEYTLNDSFLLLSGTVLNTVVVSCLLRDPPWLKRSKLSDDSTEDKDSGVYTTSNPKSAETPSILALVNGKDDSDFQVTSENCQTLYSIVDESQELYTEENSIDASNFDTLCSNNDSVLFDNSDVKKVANDPYRDSYKYDALHKRDLDAMNPLMTEKQIQIIPKKDDAGNSKRKSHLRSSVADILKEPMFYFLTFTMYVYFFGVQLVFMVIVDFAKDKGILEGHAIYLISMNSLLDLCGRAGLGWITDRNIISRRTMVAINLGILGMLYQLYPMIDSFPGLLAVSAVNGLSVGCSITLYFVLLAETMGMERLTLVNGLVNFINGVLSFLRPAIIGLFRDVIGSYNWMFHSIGFITLIFAIMWTVESHKHAKKANRVQIMKVQTQEVIPLPKL